MELPINALKRLSGGQWLLRKNACHPSSIEPGFEHMASMVDVWPWSCSHEKTREGNMRGGLQITPWLLNRARECYDVLAKHDSIFNSFVGGVMKYAHRAKSRLLGTLDNPQLASTWQNIPSRPMQSVWHAREDLLQELEMKNSVLRSRHQSCCEDFFCVLLVKWHREIYLQEQNCFEGRGIVSCKPMMIS